MSHMIAYQYVETVAISPLLPYNRSLPDHAATTTHSTRRVPSQHRGSANPGGGRSHDFPEPSRHRTGVPRRPGNSDPSFSVGLSSTLRLINGRERPSSILWPELNSTEGICESMRIHASGRWITDTTTSLSRRTSGGLMGGSTIDTQGGRAPQIAMIGPPVFWRHF